MKRYKLPVSAAFLIIGLATHVRAAEVHVHINIGAPPVILRSPPTMVYLAQPAVHVAVGVPYDVFFVSGRYYYVRGNSWYWGPGYGGPWTHVVYGSLPPGLQKYRMDQLRQLRDHEYRTYRLSRPDSRRRHFIADYGPGKSKGRGNGRGRR